MSRILIVKLADLSKTNWTDPKSFWTYDKAKYYAVEHKSVYFLGVKKVRMTVPSGSSGWPECGGASNEKIKIKISEYSCTTEAIRYEAGEVNIDWTEDLLLDCAGIKTDPTEQSLRVIVMPTIEDEGTPSRYCLSFLEVVLNDGTIYRNDSVDKKYRYGNGNGDSEVILNKV